MIKRICAALIGFLVVAILLLPQLAANIDHFLSQQLDLLSWDPRKGWSAVLSAGKALEIYLILVAVLALLLVWVLVTGGSLNNRSQMQRITPDIITPCADGQGQYGTARWLTKHDYRRYFSVWKISRRDTGMKALLQAGKSDRKEIRCAEIRID